MVWYVGASTLLREVKRKFYKDASAQIVLYGWRKDVHSFEITETRTGLAAEKEARTIKQTSFKTLQSLVEDAIRALGALHGQLRLCRKDSGSVSTLRQKRPVGEVATACIDARSIAGIAIHCGITSKLLENSFEPPKIPDLMVSLAEQNIKQALTMLETSKTTLRLK